MGGYDVGAKTEQKRGREKETGRGKREDTYKTVRM